MPDSDSLGFWQNQFAGYIRNLDDRFPTGMTDDRLAVYRELFFNNIESIIRRAFPVTISVIGEKLWMELAGDFFARHQASIRCYPRLASEFLEYLESCELDQRYPVFLRELMHYEWLELELDLAVGSMTAVKESSVLNIVPVLSPVVRLQTYSFPVHRISPDFVPDRSDQDTHLLLYRDNEWKVRFNELAPLSMALLSLVEGNKSESASGLVETLLAMIPQPVATIRGYASGFLQEMYGNGIVIAAGIAQGETA
ncbi:MAG: HvfC family RiPP maturation protein [Endozoicomonas sp.]